MRPRAGCKRQASVKQVCHSCMKEIGYVGLGQKFPSYALPAWCRTTLQGVPAVSSAEQAGKWQSCSSGRRTYVPSADRDRGLRQAQSRIFPNRGAQLFGISHRQRIRAPGMAQGEGGAAQLRRALDIKRELAGALASWIATRRARARPTRRSGRCDPLVYGRLVGRRNPAEVLRVLDAYGQTDELLPCHSARKAGHPEAA